MVKKPKILIPIISGGLGLVVFFFYASCGNGTVSSAPRIAQTSRAPQSIEPIQQLIAWETKANVGYFLENESKVDVASAKVNDNALDLEWLGEPEHHLRTFVIPEEGMVRWPKHPYNQARSVPFFTAPSDAKLSFEAFFSASRSLFFFVNGDAYTIKMPTDRPHKDVVQPTKAEMGKESRLTVPFSQHIADVDKRFGRSRDLIVLRDIAMAVEKTTSNGYTIRDLRPLQSTGKYYFPGFSFDTMGMAVMKSCTAKESISRDEFEIFWTKHYSYAAGQAKATLLLKYGVLQTTPNAQNWLIELDPATMCPTGTMVIRDIVDAKPVLPLATALGYSTFVNEWTQRGGFPRRDIDIYESNTLWQSSLENNVRALAAQRQGFVDGILKVLGTEDTKTGDRALSESEAYDSEALAAQSRRILEAMRRGTL